MELALKIFQFVLSILILVLLHELGHFLPAKWFKTRAEKFFLFFDAWFSIFAMKKINGKWQFKFFSKNQPDTKIIKVNGEKKEVPINIAELDDNDWRKHPESTKYGIGWLPMGGYVKIAGMVDESMDLEQLKKPAQDWEFRSKPAWQRLIIMLGGVTVNFFLAWFIYSALAFYKGEKYIDISKFDNGIAASKAAEKMGFKEGDKIISIDGKQEKRFGVAAINILFSNEVTVLRDGKEQTFPINEEGVAEVIRSREVQAYLSPRILPVVDSAIGNAAKAGLKKGDLILSVNAKETPFFNDVESIIRANKGKTVSVEIKRNDTIETLNIPVSKEGIIGIIPEADVITLQEYSFLESVPVGFNRTISALTMQVKQFKIIFNSKTQGYKNVGGPIAIINQMNVDKDKEGNLSINWEIFWSFTAMFSVWLAFLNLIPIPGLDGGHVLFTLWEILTGKPVPQKVLENAQTIGVIFLLGLMVLVFGNDILKLILGKL